MNSSFDDVAAHRFASSIHVHETSTERAAAQREYAAANDREWEREREMNKLNKHIKTCSADGGRDDDSFVSFISNRWTGTVMHTYDVYKVFFVESVRAAWSD